MNHKLIEFRMFQVILVLSLTILSNYIATGQNNLNWRSKIHDLVYEKLDNEKSVEIIIELNQQADLSFAKNLYSKKEKGRYVYSQLHAQAESNQKQLIEYCDAHEIEYHSFWIVNAVYARCNQEELESIAKMDEIKKIQANINMQHSEPIEMNALTLRNPETVEWGLEKIHADEVWAMGYDGDGVVIGGQDTGYDWDHEALIGKYRGWDGSSADHNYNWHDAIHEINAGNEGENPCGLDSPEPCDDHSHGTHTMGTMVGSAGSTMIGVAPGARWIGCRNMERGDGTPDTYLECFEWFLAPTDLNDENPDPDLAPHVINNSWHCPPIEGCDENYDFSIMETAITNLQSAGVVVVVSAGNYGANCSTIIDPPATFQTSFTVGATDDNDEIAGFSSRGPSSGLVRPNVSAPGVQVYSSFPNDSYGNSSGTSMAGPHVAGLVALIIQANPGLAGDVEEIQSIIEQSAVPLTTDQDCGDVPGNEVPNNTFGFGRIDALAAVSLAMGPSPLHLISFDGSYSNDEILLKWEITNKENEVYFEIQKSPDAVEWVPIGTINILETSRYNFNDDHPYQSNNYYRLKIVDLNGAYVISKSISVKRDAGRSAYIYPNPVSGNSIFIQGDYIASKPLLIDITGIEGSTSQQLSAQAASGFGAEVSVGNLTPGLYIVTIKDLSENILTKRLRFLKW